MPARSWSSWKDWTASLGRATKDASSTPRKHGNYQDSLEQVGDKLKFASPELESGQAVDPVAGSPGYCTKCRMGVGCRLEGDEYRRR